MQQAERAGAGERRERRPGLGIGEDALQLGDDPGRRQLGVRRQLERQRPRPRAPGLQREAQARGVARGPEDPRRVLDER
jgi:hypothetical protein